MVVSSIKIQNIFISSYHILVQNRCEKVYYGVLQNTKYTILRHNIKG